MELVQTQEKFPASDGFEMSAYIRRPNVPARLPGVLFIYEAFGLNEEMFRVADEIAAEGYVVLLPDLLERGSWFPCIGQVIKDLLAGAGQAVQDLIRAREWLAQRDYVEPERIAVMGLCMGGGFALLLGKTGLFKVSAPFYGKAPKNLDGLCPVVASYGGRDLMLRRDARRLEKELPVLGIPCDVKIYPGAGHSFMNRPANGFVRIMGGAMGAGYEPAAAADATGRLVRFLKEHL